MCNFITSSIGAAFRRFASVRSDGLDVGCSTIVEAGGPRPEEVDGEAAFNVAVVGEGVEGRLLCEVEGDEEEPSLEEDTAAAAASAFDRSDATEAVFARFGLVRLSDGGC